MKSNDLYPFLKPFVRPILALAGMIILTACGSSGSGGSADSGNTGNQGLSASNVVLKMTDDSGCDYSHLFVTVSEVAFNNRLNAMIGDNDWTTVTLQTPVPFDLLTLQNGTTSALASLNIPAGTYNSILLSVVPNTTSNPNNDYLTLNGSSTEYPLSFLPGFPNKVAINFSKPVTVSSNGTILNIVIDFSACDSVMTSTDAQGDVTYILKPKLTVVDENYSGGIVGAITTSSGTATAPQHLVVKAEAKGPDGNYYVVRQTHPNSDGTFKLYPLEYDDDSKGVYDVVIVSDNYGTLAIQDVTIPAVTTASIGTIKLDSYASPAVTWSTTGTFTGTISPKGTDVRIRETVGERTYEVRRNHSDLQTGIFTFPLSWGATGSEVYSTGVITIDSLTTAGSYTADTPTGDCDNDDKLVLTDQQFPFQITATDLTVIHDFTLTPISLGAFPFPSLTSSISGTVKALDLPVNDIEKVFLFALINGKYFAGMDEISLTSHDSQMPYTIDRLPVGAVVTIDAFVPYFGASGSEQYTILTGTPVTIVSGSNVGPSFTLTQ